MDAKKSAYKTNTFDTVDSNHNDKQILKFFFFIVE